MDAHDSNHNPVRLEQVIAVSLVGARSKLQDMAVKNKDNEIALLRVTGFPNAHASVPGKPPQTKPTTYIKGAFEATNLLTGEKYISGQLILPDSASGYLCAQIDNHQKVSMDITIMLLYSEKSISGYKFNAVLNHLTVE